MKRTDEELQRAGMKALIKELGAQEAIRFLLGTKLKRGDYAKERHAWVDSTSHEELIAKINELQGTHLSPGGAEKGVARRRRKPTRRSKVKT